MAEEKGTARTIRMGITNTLAVIALGTLAFSSCGDIDLAKMGKGSKTAVSASGSSCVDCHTDKDTLKIETAGSSNPYGSDMKLIGIRDAQLFKEQVLEQREKIRIKSERGAAAVDISEEQLQVLREIRDLLLEARQGTVK